MKIPAALFAAAALAFVAVSPAAAKDCLKGGVGGHSAGRHGAPGAGCLSGRHRAGDQARQQQQMQQARRQQGTSQDELMQSSTWGGGGGGGGM